MTSAPVVHCLTNDVTRQLVAAALAALGIAPVMAIAIEEVAAVAASSAALLLNCGTPTAERFGAMEAAARAARAAEVPIVIDPVGCGASPWRTTRIRELVRVARPAVVRGNAAEVAALVDDIGPALAGVSAEETSPQEAERIAAAARNALDAVALVTAHGLDVIAGADRIARLTVDAPVLSRVVGGGDVLSALVAAHLAMGEPAYAAGERAHRRFGAAARHAAASGPGSFWERFVNAVGAHD